MGRFLKEVEETKAFIAFLEKTKRDQAIDQHSKTKDCLHVLEDFSAIAPRDFKGTSLPISQEAQEARDYEQFRDLKETTQHLSKVNKDYENFRAHALDCERCQISLDAILLFKGYNNPKLFPEKINKILKREWEYDKEKGVYITKLPAPYSGNWSSRARLVYTTSFPVQQAVGEFIERIQKPLNLKSLIWDKKIIRKTSGLGKHYFQANAHHKRDAWHTYLSIRSKSAD